MKLTFKKVRLKLKMRSVLINLTWNKKYTEHVSKMSALFYNGVSTNGRKITISSTDFMGI